MRNPDKTPPAVKRVSKPRDIAERLAERTPFDRNKVRKSSRRAVEAADRLIKEMADVMKQLDRKR